MAILSNINGKFAVESTGAIQFNGSNGTSGYVLMSNGNASPTWVDPDTIIGPYLPLAGGTLTGATATASGISFTVGGVLTGTSATFSSNVDVTGSVISRANANYYSTRTYLGDTWEFASDTTDGVTFKITGGAANTTGNFFKFQTQAGGATAATALTINKDLSATFGGDVTIGGTTGSTGNALAVNRGSDGTQALRIQNSGEVVIPSNYLYCNAGGTSLYVQNTAVFRGSIINDGGDVTIGDTLSVTGNATFTGAVNAVSYTASDYINIQVDDAEAYWTNTANTDYWRWKRDANNNFKLDHYNGTATNNALTFDNTQNATFTGNVGIGVTPSTGYVDSRAIELGANGYIWSEQTASIYGSFMTGVGFYYNAAGATIYKTTSLQISRHVQYQGEHIFQYAAAGTAGNSITWSEAFRTSDTGNVGIGTTSPEANAKLDVRAGSGGKIVLGTYDANYKVVVEGGDQLNFYNGASAATAYINYTGPGNILLSRNLFVEANASGGTSGMVRIKSDGKVGIGNTNPLRPVDITADSGAVCLNLRARSQNDYAFIQWSNHDRSVYLGETYVAASGGAASSMNWNVGTTHRMSLNNSGTLTVTGDLVAYGSPSDISLKENIKPIKNPLGKIKKLKGITFDWKKSESILDIKEDYGFIAQDVQKVIPELVRKNENKLLSMRHQGIIPILVEAIKELEARVKELENK